MKDRPVVLMVDEDRGISGKKQMSLALLTIKFSIKLSSDQTDCRTLIIVSYQFLKFYELDFHSMFN